MSDFHPDSFEGRVIEGLTEIKTLVGAQTKTLDDHEGRIRSIEVARNKLSGATRAWGALGTLGGLGSLLNWLFHRHPPH